MDKNESGESQRQTLVEKICTLQSSMLRGTLVEKNIRCGHANCRCSKGHFHQAFYLAYTENRKTRTVHIPKSLVAHVQEAIENYRHFKDIVNRISQINLSSFTERKRVNSAQKRKTK